MFDQLGYRDLRKIRPDLLFPQGVEISSISRKVHEVFHHDDRNLPRAGTVFLVLLLSPRPGVPSDLSPRSHLPCMSVGEGEFGLPIETSAPPPPRKRGLETQRE